jgi:hypothetical protein
MTYVTCHGSRFYKTKNVSVALMSTVCQANRPLREYIS